VYTVSFKKSAIKALRRMPPKVASRMFEELEQIAENPSNHIGDWKKLVGSEYWRLRIGSYRAICDLRDDELVLLVITVGSRGDVYK
jgi:mRNA interferase RelE/StbE